MLDNEGTHQRTSRMGAADLISAPHMLEVMMDSMMLLALIELIRSKRCGMVAP